MTDPVVTVCPRCLKDVRVAPHRAGDLPNRPVHIATGKEEC